METFYPSQDILDKMRDVVPKKIIVHHSGASSKQTKESLRDHFLITRKAEGYIWIGYHACIWPDGTVIQTRPFTKNGGHCPQNGHNSNIGICFMGDFTQEEVTPQAWESFVSLCTSLFSEFGITQGDIIPHRTAKGEGGTLCPSDAIIKKLSEPFHEPMNPLVNIGSIALVEELLRRLKV